MFDLGKENEEAEPQIRLILANNKQQDQIGL